MRLQQRFRRSIGFTLIELLIVMAILGIVATITLGVIRNQSETARRVANDETVRRTREAIALYRQQTGILPNLIAGWEPLTTRTTINGRTVGPFLLRPPRNALVTGAANPSCVADGNVPILYLEDCTFLYDYNGGHGTGRFIAANQTRPPTEAISRMARFFEIEPALITATSRD